MKCYDFLADLSADVRQRLLESAKEVCIDAHTILFYQGDVCKNILMLEEGDIRVYINGEHDEAITLYHIACGDQCIVNTSSLLSQTPAIGTAETLTPIKGWLISYPVVKELLAKSPEYQHYMFGLFSLRFQSLVNLIEDIKFKRLNQRILEWLARQPDTTIHITHETLATTLGTSRVVISRVLKEMEKEGKLKLGRGSISKIPL